MDYPKTGVVHLLENHHRTTIEGNDEAVTQAITLTPQRYLLTVDGAELPYTSWEEITQEVKRQASIHNCHYSLICYDAADEEILERFFFHRQGKITAVTAQELETPTALAGKDRFSLPVRSATLKYQDWELFIESVQSRSIFRSLRLFTQNAELVAQGNNRRFTTEILGLSPLQESKTLVFGQEEPETTADDTNSFVTQLTHRPVQQEDYQPPQRVPQNDQNMEQIQSALEESSEELPEEESTVSNETVGQEDEDEATEPANTSDDEAGIDSETFPKEETTIEAPGRNEEATLLEDFFSDTNAEEHLKRRSHRASLKNPLKSFNLTSKKVLIPLSLSASVLLAAATGVGLQSLNHGPGNTATAQSAISDISQDLPEGYSNQPAWTTPIPESAEVLASEAALAIIHGNTVTLHSLTDGKPIDTVESSWPISTIDETIIDGKNALVWLDETGTKLTSWHRDTDGNPHTQTLDLPEGAQVSKNSEELLVQTDTQVYRLTTQGLKTYPVPTGLTPFAFAPEGLISIGYDVPVEITDADGAPVRSTNISSPAEGHIMNQWVAVGQAISLSVWSQELEPTSKTPVLLTTHSLATGEVLDTIETTFGDIDPGTTWTIGQGNRLATYQNRVFSLTDGKYIAAVPLSLSAPAAKGNLVVATASESKKQYLFSGDSPGYALNQKFLLAQTSTLLITQSGNRVVAYPATLS